MGNRRSWYPRVGLLVLALAFLYVVVLPLVRPRGAYLWGHYRLLDIYAGVPLVLAVLCVIAILAAPAYRRRGVALRATTVTGAVLFALFLVEVAYTVAQPRFHAPDFWLDGGGIERAYSITDPELGFARKPNVAWHRSAPEGGRPVSYRTDTNGFRNPAGIIRGGVVFIGDSFTEAAWIPENETFVRRVAATTGLSVVNLGRGAYGPQQELIVLRRHGVAYQPRFVVWQLFEGNDLDDANNFEVWRAGRQPPPPPLLARYYDNSLLRRVVEPTVFPSPVSGRVSVVVSYHDGTRQRKDLRYRYIPDRPRERAEAFEATVRAVEDGMRLCAAHGIQLAVLFVPSLVQVMEPFLTFDHPMGRDRALPGGRVRSADDFGSRLRSVCIEPACTYLEAFEPLRAQALLNNSHIYDRHDPDEHLDVDGHAVVSRLVVDWIRSRTKLGGIESDSVVAVSDRQESVR
jgi:hypothetical protein